MKQLSMKRFFYWAACFASLAASVALAAVPAGSAPQSGSTVPAGKAAKAGKAGPTGRAAPASRGEPEAPVTPVTNMSAAQIVEKNVAARGGLAAWTAVTSMTMTGEMEAGGEQNTPLPFVMTMKRPHKSRLEIRFQDQAAVQVYDGTKGWKVRPYLNRNEVESYTPAEAKSAASASELDGPLIDYAKKGTKVDLVGAQAVEGKNAYKLKLTFKDGTQRHLWIDATSFLEAKMEGEPRKMDGKLRNVAVYYRDYKTEKGLTAPRVFETAVEGFKQTHKIIIKSVAVNQPVDDALFAKPQLIAKASGQ
jgi:hypothetical protein